MCDGLVRSLCLQGGDERGEKRRFIFCQYGDLYIPILIKILGFLYSNPLYDSTTVSIQVYSYMYY